MSQRAEDCSWLKHGGYAEILEERPCDMRPATDANSEYGQRSKDQKIVLGARDRLQRGFSAVYEVF